MDSWVVARVAKKKVGNGFHLIEFRLAVGTQEMQEGTQRYIRFVLSPVP